MCPDCGFDLKGTENYCPNCGHTFHAVHISKPTEIGQNQMLAEQNQLLRKMVGLQATTAAYTMLQVFWH